MAQHVNLNALRVFAIAAREGSFQGAAAVLHISHGAVSQRIKQLEQDLGVTLFERQPRGVALTAAGAQYCRAVEEALGLLETATADLARGAGEVTLHLGPSFAARWLMPRMRGFAARHAEITLTTEVHETPLARPLGRGEIAIWPGRAPAVDPGLELRCLTRLQLVAVCSPDLPRPDRPMDLAALLGLPLLQDAHRHWDRLVAEAGGQGGQKVLNFDRSALALEAAGQGHGVAMAPSYLVDTDLRAGRLVEIWRPEAAPDRHLYLAWARVHGQDRPLRQVVAWVLSEFGL